MTLYDIALGALAVLTLWWGWREAREVYLLWRYRRAESQEAEAREAAYKAEAEEFLQWLRREEGKQNADQG